MNLRFKTAIVRHSALGVGSSKFAQIRASEKSKKIVSAVLFRRTERPDPGDEGAATMPMTIAILGFGTNYRARGEYWSDSNASEDVLFEGRDFIESLPGLQKKHFKQVSRDLGNVVEIQAAKKIHVPTIIGTSFIAFQQCLINAPVFFESVRHPDNDIIAAAAELSKGVGSKWGVLPGSVNPWLAFGGYSALSGTPAGASHLTRDLKEVSCTYLLKKIREGMKSEEAIIQMLAGANLNFAAVKPAAKQTLITAQEFPVGPFNVFPNILLSQVFNDNGLEVILEVRNRALDEAIAVALSTLKLPTISSDTLVKYRDKADKDSKPYVEEIVAETQVSAPILADAIKEEAQSI